MKRCTLWWSLLAAVVVAPGAAFAGTSVDFSVAVGNAPPPPAIVFREEPHLFVVPGSTVYVVKDDCDYDVFRYGVYWYVFNEGNWYRARTHRGPYQTVSARYVPTAIVNVPPRYWRQPHYGRPGQMRRHGEVAMVREREGRERGR